MKKEPKIVNPSKLYLVWDPKKCTGCVSCMLACSLAHEGVENLSLSRIQIKSDPFDCFPDDIEIFPCLQCRFPECYYACPEKDKALSIDKETGIRYINPEDCIGCGACRKACLYTPSRIGWDSEKKVSFKCNLCRKTAYWDEQGKPVCVEVCPTNALKITDRRPRGYDSYIVNLRGEGWAKIGFPTD